MKRIFAGMIALAVVIWQAGAIRREFRNRDFTGRKWKFRGLHFKVEPRDAWLGIYWNFNRLGIGHALFEFRVFVCLIPFCPVVFVWNNSFAE